MLRSLFLVKALGREMARIAVPTVTLSSAVMFAPSVSVGGVIELGVDTIGQNSVYDLATADNPDIEKVGDGFRIETGGDIPAIENVSMKSTPIPEKNTIVVGEGKTLHIVHDDSNETALRMSAGVSNPFSLTIEGSLDIKVKGGEIRSSDAIVYVNGESYDSGVKLEVTEDMSIEISDVNIVANKNGSYGVGIAEGDLAVGGDFSLTMSNMSYRVSKWYPGQDAKLYALHLGTGATDGETSTKYTFSKDLKVSQVGFYNPEVTPEDDVPTMVATGVYLEDSGYTEDWETVRLTRELTVAENFTVGNVSVTAGNADAEAYGLNVLGEGSSVTVSGATTITDIKAETGEGSAYAAAIEASDGATVQLSGAVTIKNVSASEAYALVASDGATINIAKSESEEGKTSDEKDIVIEDDVEQDIVIEGNVEQDIVIEGNVEKDIVIEGDVQINGGDAVVNMNLATLTSWFRGYTWNTYAEESSKNDISLSKGATWYVPGDNYLQGNLNVEESGTVDLYSRGDDSDSYTTLTVQTFSGDGGLIKLRATIDSETENDYADALVIEKEASGQHKLEVKGNGQGGKEAMDSFLVQSQSDTGALDFSLANPNERVDIGVYNYALASRDSAEYEGGKEWYLVRATKTDPTPENPTPENPTPENPTPDDPQPVLSPTGEAVLALTSPSAQTVLFLQNLSTLRGRLGEIRSGNAWADSSCVVVSPDKNGKNALPAVKREHRPQGFYVRTAAGQDHVPGFRGQDFRNNYWGGAVGYFRQTSEQCLFGAELNTMQGRQRLQRPSYLSKGESESYGLLASATWFNKTGHYWDFVVGFDHYEQKLSTHMLNGTPVTASFTSVSPAVSVEWGRKFSLGRDRRSFIEPQCQLTYYRAGGDDYVTSNGMSVHRPDMNSLTGRLGVAVGRSHQYPSGKGFQWHIDAGVLHEFCDDAKAVVNGETFTAASPGTRVYYGVGGEYNVTRRTQVYGYVGQEQGSDYKNDGKASLGIRFTF